MDPQNENNNENYVEVPLGTISQKYGGQLNVAFVPDDEESSFSKVNQVNSQSNHGNGQCKCCNDYGILIEQLKIYYPSVASQLVTDEKEEPVKVIWQNLSVDTNVRSSLLPFSRKIHKEILQPMNGFITAGTMTALMGPSGAGKTTLLNSICGKLRTGVTGERIINVPKSQENSIRIGFVPQNDSLFIQFTVYETVLFSSRLTNGTLSKQEHISRVKSILKQLDLTKFSDQKVSKLSGGQLKRTCIAVELISNPKILLLDEPTTGLDSANAENVISLLKEIVTKAGKLAPAIVATIHQPSYDLFEMFDSIYLLSRNGCNIYHGPPDEILDYFEKFGFEKKTNVNPADYAIEISNGKYGSEKFTNMRQITFSKTSDSIEELKNSTNNGQVEIKVEKFKQKVAKSFYQQFILVTARSFKAYMFSSSLLMMKFILNLILSVFLCSLFDEPVGTLNGCWHDFITESKPNYTDETEALRNSLLESIEKNKMAFDQTKNITKLASATNFMLVYVMYYMFTFSISAVLIIPSELKVVKKEISNSWYQVPAYYLGKVLTDLVVLIVTSTLPIIYAFYASEHTPEIWRCLYLVLFIFLLTGAWEARGSIIGIICSFDQIFGIIVDIGLMFPTLFLSGFFVQYSKLAEPLKPLTSFSDLKYSFRGILLSLYGFGRCTRGEQVEGFYKQLENEVTTVRMFNIMWTSLNFTNNEMRRFEKVINLEDGFLDPIYQSMVDFYGESTSNNYEKTNYQPSYILGNSDIDESTFEFCIIYCVINLIILKLIIWPLLYYKTRVSRL